MNKKAMGVLFFIILTNSSVHTLAAPNYREKALVFIENGKIKNAVIELKNHLQQMPDDTEARLLLSEMYLKQRNGFMAFMTLKKLAKEVPEEKWIVPLAKAYQLQNKQSQIIDEIKIKDQFPKFVRTELYTLRGKAYLTKHDNKAATDNFKAALQINNHFNEALLGLAAIELQRQQFNKAKSYINQVLENDNNNLKAWTNLGKVERLLGNLQPSLEAYNRAVAIQKDYNPARLGRLTTYIAMQEYDKLQKDMEWLENNNENPLELSYAKGVLAFQKREYNKAESEFKKILDVLPNHKDSLLLLGSTLYSKGDNRQASIYLNQFHIVNPKQLQATKLLVKSYINQQHFKNALRILKIALKENQSDSELFSLIGSIYVQQKKPDAALEYLNQAVKLAPKNPTYKTALAKNYLDMGQLENAAKELKAAIQLEQKSPLANALLIEVLQDQGKFTEALNEANKLIKLIPDDLYPKNLLAMVYQAMGDETNARKYWQQVLTLQPLNEIAIQGLAQIEIKHNALNAAEQRYKQLLQDRSDNQLAMIGLAQIAQIRKNSSEILRWLQKAHEIHPEAVKPALLLSQYYRSKNPETSLQIATDLAEKNPENIIVLENLAHAQLAAKKYAVSIRSFKKLIKQNPDNKEFHYLLAQALYQNNDVRAAENEWQAALSLDPTYWPARAARIESALKQKNFIQASADIQKLKKNHPDLPTGYYLEGEIQSIQNNFSAAINAYKQAYTLDRNSLIVRRLFQVYAAAGMESQAFDILEAWLKEHEKDTGSWMILAQGYQKNGDLKKAINRYEKAKMYLPDNPAIINNLAWLYQRTGDARALNFAEQALNLSPDDPNVMDTAGWIFVENDEATRGAILLLKAVNQAPDDVTINMHLARALIKAGQPDLAKKVLNKLIHSKIKFEQKKQAQALLNSL